MKILQKLTGSILITLVTCTTVFAGEAPYTDGFITEAAYAMHEWDIFSGRPDGSFDPYTEMNRAELAKVLVLAALNEDEVATCAADTEWTFTDVPTDQWYTNYVYCAKAKGWVSGDEGKNTFRPGDPVLMGETFKMIVESQYGTPGASYEGSAWYELYLNFLEDYQMVEAYTPVYSDTTYYTYPYLWIGYADGYIGFDSDSMASKMFRLDIAELLYRMKIVFEENNGESYNLLYTFDELEEFYGTEIELGDTLSVADPHFGFRFENVPVEKLDVNPEDWRVYIEDPSAFENGDRTSWHLVYPTGDAIEHASGYKRIFYISIYDSTYSASQYDFEDETGKSYLWWCSASGRTVEELLAHACVVDAEQNVDATYVNFSEY